MIAAVSPVRRAPTLVPVWLTVPGHCDIAQVGDEDLAAELRRRGYAAFPLGVELEVHGLRVPARAGTLRWGGRAVGVTHREADVLRALAGAWPRPVPTVHLAVLVWGDTCAEPHARLYVRYVRRKVPGLIVTEQKGGGYRLALEENGHA